MTTLKFFGLWVACLLFLANCQKKDEKALPRCIYDQTVFADVALRSIHDEGLFSHFKCNPFFNLLWENLNPEEGIVWLQKIYTQFPELLEKLDRFRENDAIGSPRAYSFGDVGVFSPSTLRLAAMAGDLQQRVGELSHLRVVQIGAGCGSLCKILNDLADFESFTLVDLPEQLALAKKCLEKLGVKNVAFLTPEELRRDAVYDLVISDLSFSEFNRSYQEVFFDRILSRSRYGYLHGRIFPKHFGVIALNADELKRRFEKLGKFSEWEMLEPAIDREDYFIYWKKEPINIADRLQRSEGVRA